MHHPIIRLASKSVEIVRRSGRSLRLACMLALLAVPAAAQVWTSGRWSSASPSVLSSDPAKRATPIHMAWMRGDDDWAANSAHYHSYLFWWNNRDDFCNTAPRFKGALYGWKPGQNSDCTGSMMESGFTRLQIADDVLDPSGDAAGHDIFCAGQTMLDDGRLMVAGGAEGEGFTLADADTAWVDFVTPAAPASGTREWFLAVEGHPLGYQPSAGALNARHAPIAESLPPARVLRLAGGLPNPFTSSTRVLFELPRAAAVRLEVWDMQGRLIRSIEDRFEAGTHGLVWDRRMTNGALAPRGVYPIRLTAGEQRVNGRLTVR